MNRRYKDRPEQRDEGALIHIGRFLHPCTNDGYNVAVLESTNKGLVPKFNSPVYNDKGADIGIIDEVFGPIAGYYFTIKTHPNVNPKSFSVGQSFQIREGRTMPLSRFTNPPPPPQRQAKQGVASKKGHGKPTGKPTGRQAGKPGDRRRDSKGPSPFNFTRDNGNHSRDRDRQGPRPNSGVTRNRFSNNRV